MAGGSRKFTRRATLGLAAGAGFGSLVIGYERSAGGSTADPETVWQLQDGDPTRRRYAPVDPGLEPGDEVWSVEIERGEPFGLRVGAECAYYTSRTGPWGATSPLSAVDRTDGGLLWQYRPSAPFGPPGNILGGPRGDWTTSLTVFGDTVYVPAVGGALLHGSAGTLHAVEASTGRLRWIHEGPNYYSRLSLPGAIVHDGLAYFSTAVGGETALSRYTPETGRHRGRLLEGSSLGLAAADSTGLIITRYDRPSEDDIDPKLVSTTFAGSPHWSHRLPTIVTDFTHMIQPVVTDDRVLVQTDSYPMTVLRAIRRANGREAWRRDLDRDFLGDPDPPIAASDSTCFAVGDEGVIAIDLDSGRTVWKRRVISDGGRYIRPYPVVSPNHLYLPRVDGITRLDPETGRPSGDRLLTGRWVSEIAIVEDALYAIGKASDGQSQAQHLYKLAPT